MHISHHGSDVPKERNNREEKEKEKEVFLKKKNDDYLVLRSQILRFKGLNRFFQTCKNMDSW